MKTRSLSNQLRKSHQAGFSIIEVLLVSFLLFLLSYSTYMSIRGAMNTKKSIDTKSEVLQSGRSVLQLLARDLRAVFFVDARDLGWNPIKEKTAEELRAEGKRAEEIDQILASQEPTPATPVPLTLFQGTQNELLFSARSHQRMSADSPENEQHFVRYRVDGSSLIREESLRAIRKEDISEEENWRQFTVLETLQSIEYEFYNVKTERWEQTWDTNSSRNLDTLPYLIRIKLSYKAEAAQQGEELENELNYEMTVRILQTAFKDGAIKWPERDAPEETPSGDGDGDAS